MIFCGETILPGNRKWVQLPVPGAQTLECVCLCGVKPGQTLAVTAGVHGCEYVGVQALRTLARELVPDDMTGNVILLPLANPYGFYAGAKRVIPEDGVNLNGAFPGDRNGMSANSSTSSSDESRIELESPNVQTKASTICIVVLYSRAKLTALSDSRKHSMNASAYVMKMRGFLCH